MSFFTNSQCSIINAIGIPSSGIAFHIAECYYVSMSTRNRLLLLYDPDGCNNILDLFCHFVMSAYHNGLRDDPRMEHDYEKFQETDNSSFATILTEHVGTNYAGSLGL